jgi:hypothetical protein
MASLITCAGPAVTCIGEDGHVMVEVVSANCCDQSPEVPFQVSRRSYTNATYVASTGSCGSCIDIPTFASNEIQWLTSAPKKSSPLKVLSTTTISILNNAGLHEGFIAKIGNPINSTLAPIRTTVLII